MMRIDLKKIEEAPLGPPRANLAQENEGLIRDYDASMNDVLRQDCEPSGDLSTTRRSYLLAVRARLSGRGRKTELVDLFDNKLEVDGDRAFVNIPTDHTPYPYEDQLPKFFVEGVKQDENSRRQGMERRAQALAQILLAEKWNKSTVQKEKHDEADTAEDDAARKGTKVQTVLLSMEYLREHGFRFMDDQLLTVATYDRSNRYPDEKEAVSAGPTRNQEFYKVVLAAMHAELPGLISVRWDFQNNDAPSETSMKLVRWMKA